MKINLKLKFNNKNPYKEIHSHHDWQMLVYAFLILVVLVIGGNIFLYYYYQQDVPVPVRSFNSGIAVKKVNDVQKMENFFSQRESNLASSTAQNFIDPSL